MGGEGNWGARTAKQSRLHWRWTPQYTHSAETRGDTSPRRLPNPPPVWHTTLALTPYTAPPPPSSTTTSTHCQVKTEFMQLWDGMESERGQRIVVVGATNRPGALDDAILRRFAVKYEVGCVWEQARGSGRQR